ncbi:MAG: 30S ribosomal protein S6 [Candidatus Yanofskybacteria bacterium RIFCSPHIGHO2_01_FULL_39_44]|uniref:Small ribosomal subunit protein bS6 n=1 Tax=Candidatus Yanofskybacteria bacterium RIFCSPHIGHO2_02_FULL_43_22 TaxID=1802681 RepID=A0A1F8FQH1_9BACT|nr:MAG: 30S ribosomal protein S6 [Candidatus Yanofskybacteria bacterium RIFCSPHIGHO2_01_FULL_39_44]OGN15285.1 MAG: 30S ribosomal protein S6 [Candidatus Yanofskybacteria bacterium RIFCSPHIGHO2_02_FULL_43_22]
MTDLERQNYELAFHISPTLDEADVQKTRQDLEKYITSHGGAVSFVKDPERIRLAYPINHQLNTFFGFFNFNLESPEAVQQIRDELRLNPNVVRFLILKQKEVSKSKQDGVVRRLAMAEKRRTRMAKPEKPTVKQQVPKADEKAIDEKLEEIIDKL